MGLQFNRSGGWFGGARIRYLGAGPLSRDNTIRSRPSLQLYGESGYQLDRRDDDIEYYYASQLRGEAAPVSGVHAHPMEPRSFRASLSYYF